MASDFSILFWPRRTWFCCMTSIAQLTFSGKSQRIQSFPGISVPELGHMPLSFLTMSVALCPALGRGHSTGAEKEADIEVGQSLWETRREKWVGSIEGLLHHTTSPFVYVSPNLPILSMLAQVGFLSLLARVVTCRQSWSVRERPLIFLRMWPLEAQKVWHYLEIGSS